MKDIIDKLFDPKRCNKLVPLTENQIYFLTVLSIFKKSSKLSQIEFNIVKKIIKKFDFDENEDYSNVDFGDID
jgi:hypothetical protein